jgi:hypothetical protein
MEYIAYFMSGLGIGIAFFYMFYDTNSITRLERDKHDLAVRKEWFSMLAEQKRTNPKWPKGWN